MEIYKYEVLKDIPADYDSPFEFVVTRMADSIAQFTDDGVMKAVINAGFNIDKDKLVSALDQDKERYDTAYRKGYATGYKKREEEIVRCEDCAKRGFDDCPVNGWMPEKAYGNWHCGDGVRKEVIE